MMKKRVFAKVVSFVSAFIMSFSMAAYLPAHAEEELTDERAAQLIKQVEMLVNQARAEAGLKPMYVLPYLNEIAEIRAFESSIDFKHTRNGGSESFTSVIDQSIVPYGFAAENLAAGFGDPEVTFEQWRHSEKHWAAIMNPDVTHMGVGVYYDEDTEFGWYWQQMFVATDVEYADQYIPRNYEAEPEAVGDVNGDGIVNTYDYIVLTDYIRKKKTDYPVYLNKAQLDAADCFKDGIITESDAKVLARYILGEYKSLPFVF